MYQLSYLNGDNCIKSLFKFKYKDNNIVFKIEFNFGLNFFRIGPGVRAISQVQGVPLKKLSLQFSAVFARWKAIRMFRLKFNYGLKKKRAHVQILVQLFSKICCAVHLG